MVAPGTQLVLPANTLVLFDPASPVPPSVMLEPVLVATVLPEPSSTGQMKVSGAFSTLRDSSETQLTTGKPLSVPPFQLR